MSNESNPQEKDITKITVTYSDGSTEDITTGFACLVEGDDQQSEDDLTGTWYITENCDMSAVSLLCNDFVGGMLTGIHWDNDISVVQEQ